MTVTRESLGTTSFRISSRFPRNSGESWDNPVIFPPGRARLATNPLPTGSSSCAMTIGIVDVASLGGTCCSPASRDNDVDLQTDKFSCKRGHTIWFSLWRSPLDHNVFSLHVTKLAQPLPECLGPIRHGREGSTSKVSNPRGPRRLLRLGCTGKRKHNQHNEQSA